ncbi:hypothetical protein HQ49_01985 [Porphyromonas gulae]|nr:hypothetical protein HQ49_01985 [Porphyromonas gulae]
MDVFFWRFPVQDVFNAGFLYKRGAGNFGILGARRKKNVRLPNLLRKRNVQPSTKKRAFQGRAVPLTNEF